jgi:hypothetical protein
VFIVSTETLIRHLWQLKTIVFLHWCLTCAVLFTIAERVLLHCQVKVESVCLRVKYHAIGFFVSNRQKVQLNTDLF